MSDQSKKLSNEEMEAELLAGVDDILEKSAAAAVDLPLPSADAAQDDRLEDKAAEVEVEAEEEEEPSKNRAGWGPMPSVARQRMKYPETVRSLEPTTLILRLTDSKNLDVYNDILRKADDIESPQVELVDVERRFHEGEWHVCLTYKRIEYQQI